MSERASEYLEREINKYFKYLELFVDDDLLGHPIAEITGVVGAENFLKNSLNSIDVDISLEEARSLLIFKSLISPFGMYELKDIGKVDNEYLSKKLLKHPTQFNCQYMYRAKSNTDTITENNGAYVQTITYQSLKKLWNENKEVISFVLNNTDFKIYQLGSKILYMPKGQDWNLIEDLTKFNVKKIINSDNVTSDDFENLWMVLANVKVSSLLEIIAFDDEAEVAKLMDLYERTGLKFQEKNFIKIIETLLENSEEIVSLGEYLKRNNEDGVRDLNKKIINLMARTMNDTFAFNYENNVAQWIVDNIKLLDRSQNDDFLKNIEKYYKFDVLEAVEATTGLITVVFNKALLMKIMVDTKTIQENIEEANKILNLNSHSMFGNFQSIIYSLEFNNKRKNQHFINVLFNEDFDDLTAHQRKDMALKVVDVLLDKSFQSNPEEQLINVCKEINLHRKLLLDNNKKSVDKKTARANTKI